MAMGSTGAKRKRMGGRGNLWARITELEAEVQECRTLNLRIAELTDLVVELLVPLADSDDPRVTEIIDRYRSGLQDSVAPRDPARQAPDA